MLDAVVMLSSSTGSLSFNGYLPFEDGCNSFKRIEFGKWSHLDDIKLNHSFSEIFPQKANDLKQCPLYVAPFKMAPFTIPVNDSWTGLDVELLKLWSKSLNFSIRYLNFSGFIPRGKELSNGSFDGIMSLVRIVHDFLVSL